MFKNAASLALLGLVAALNPSARAEEYPESVSRPPISDEDPRPEVTPTRCNSRDEGYSICGDYDRDLIDSFSFVNQGANRIVTRPTIPGDMSPQRWFDFNYHSHARQELYFSISDMPTETVSSFLESYFMIFPRIVLPSIRAEEGRYTVTLPNKETLIFDAKSKEMTGGVMAEMGEMKEGVYPRIQYRGTGVLIRVNRRGEDPRVGTKALITSGSQSCTVPSAALWTQDHIRFRFPTDEAFDAFLRSRCPFGLPGAYRLSKVMDRAQELKGLAGLD